jgi:hypothetical protein
VTAFFSCWNLQIRSVEDTTVQLKEHLDALAIEGYFFLDIEPLVETNLIMCASGDHSGSRSLLQTLG